MMDPAPGIFDLVVFGAGPAGAALIKFLEDAASTNTNVLDSSETWATRASFMIGSCASVVVCCGVATIV